MGSNPLALLIRKRLLPLRYLGSAIVLKREEGQHNSVARSSLIIALGKSPPPQKKATKALFLHPCDARQITRNRSMLVKNNKKELLRDPYPLHILQLQKK